MIMGGSEDGTIYLWDIKSGEIASTLQAHEDVVYCGVWSAAQGIIASCSDDQTVRTWAGSAIV
jgi:WD40 repeat protein